MEKWNELCYILSENLPSNINEQFFEYKVIQAFEKLGWSEFNNEIIVRESIQIGATNRISPDLIFRSMNKENLFVVEVKRPSLDISAVNFQNQLSSYMGIMRVEIGILIGNKIQIFLDGKTFNKPGIILIDEIKYGRDSDKGLEFIELFKKSNFSAEKVKNHGKSIIEKLKEKEELEKLQKHLLSENYLNTINDLIKKDFQGKYDENIIQDALNNIEIRILKKDPHFDTISSHDYTPKKTEKSATQNFRILNNTNDKLPIGKYIRKTLSELIKENKIDTDEIKHLQQPDYSKTTFDIQFPFLAKESSKYYEKIRYWKNPYFINGEMFYVCSQWYETSANNDRPYYENWLRKMRNNN